MSYKWQTKLCFISHLLGFFTQTDPFSFLFFSFWNLFFHSRDTFGSLCLLSDLSSGLIFRRVTAASIALSGMSDLSSVAAPPPQPPHPAFPPSQSPGLNLGVVGLDLYACPSFDDRVNIHPDSQGAPVITHVPRVCPPVKFLGELFGEMNGGQSGEGRIVGSANKKKEAREREKKKKHLLSCRLAQQQPGPAGRVSGEEVRRWRRGEEKEFFFFGLSINRGVNGCEVQSARRSFASSFGPVGDSRGWRSPQIETPSPPPPPCQYSTI